MNSQAGDSIGFCAVATRAYLPQVRALGAGIRRFHPQAQLFVLVPDAKPEREECGAFQPIGVADLPGAAELADATFYYSAFELSNALKGHLHRYMFEKTAVRKWLYLDGDMMVLGNLSPVFEQLENGSILLSAHLSQPLPDALVDPAETEILRHGIFNGGMLGLRRKPETQRFIAWFCSRLVKFAFAGFRQLFVDQLWLNLVPSLFRETAICGHAGVNVGHWNLHERRLEKAPDGKVKVNGNVDLLLLHLSGWSREQPEEVSAHAPAYRGNAPQNWPELGRRYLAELEAQARPGTPPEYGFARFTTGQEITPRMRHMYFEMLERGERLPDSPFASAEIFKHAVARERAELSFSGRVARKAKRLLLAGGA